MRDTSRYYLRLVSQSVWSGTVDAPDEMRQRALGQFTLREGEPGLSLYEVCHPAERRLVAAAVACDRCKDEPVDVLEISAEELARYGEVMSTPGDTPVPRANLLHRELQWNCEQLEALVTQLLSEGRKAQRFSRQEVRAALCGLDPGELLDDTARVWLQGVQERHRP